MSQWTQVCGIIRVDDTGVLKQKYNVDLMSVLGIDAFNDEGNFYGVDLPDCVKSYPNLRFIPFGSEAAIHFEHWHNPDNTCMASDVISFFGSLRDFGEDECELLAKWFEDVVKEYDEKCVLVRQAVITYDCEFEKTVTITMVRDDTNELAFNMKEKIL